MERARRTDVVLSHGPQWEQKRWGLHTLVSKVGSIRLVEVEWQVLDKDHLRGSGHALDSLGNFRDAYSTVVWDGESDICHDSDHHVLLDIKLPRVETPRVVEGGELPGREGRFQEFTSKEGKQLSDICRNSDTRLTNKEELVDKRSVNRSIRVSSRV